jgi:hypothetical protein
MESISKKIMASLKKAIYAKGPMNIFVWSSLGAGFGVVFGMIGSLFKGGPTLTQGIAECWWWFAAAGLIKSVTDFAMIRSTKNL